MRLTENPEPIESAHNSLEDISNNFENRLMSPVQKNEDELRETFESFVSQLDENVKNKYVKNEFPYLGFKNKIQTIRSIFKSNFVHICQPEIASKLLLKSYLEQKYLNKPFPFNNHTRIETLYSQNLLEQKALNFAKRILGTNDLSAVKLGDITNNFDLDKNPHRVEPGKEYFRALKFILEPK